MTTDSFFALACVAVIALLFGFVMAFNGYRFFLILLPIWGFFFGFGLGAQTVQAIFGTGFLSDVTSWVVGFVVAVAFAVLSYLFYIVAVALISGSLGYAIGAGIMYALTPNFGLLVWLVGIVVGVVLAVAVLALNIQKLVIILATALLGTGVIIGTFLFLIGGLPSAQLVANPVAYVLRNSPFWLIIFIIVAAFAFFVQWRVNRNWEVKTYNRMQEYEVSSP